MIKVESVAAVLALHWHVAKSEGLFTEEGLDVEIVTPPPPKPFAPGDPRLVDPRLGDPFNYQDTTEQRYEKLERGEVDAATLMEPWITLAEKNGFKKIIETHYLGVENISQDLDRATLDKLMRAIRKAVRLINADKKRHVHHMLAEI